MLKLYVLLTLKKKLIIGVVWRHPKFANVEEFLLKSDETLNSISFDKKFCYILRDLNVNMYDKSCQ